ncbi:hypothetical protein [Sanyastnella coralliicola]|uniref:hypothetical protein n=1 Tax=Sanyastnella coralliicola TaxID=3069118 RepID=UPI0027BA7B6C|nr:hypothetical protein [Longitalea sp. SCSIO 12813]
MKKKALIGIGGLVLILLIVQLYRVESDRQDEMGGLEDVPSYRIITQSEVHDLKCTLDIEISERTNYAQLKSIAEEIIDDLPKDYERIFMLYYLPGMKLGTGAWATTHTQKHIQVEFLGLTLDEQLEFDQYCESIPKKGTLGLWYDEWIYPSIIRLSEEGDDVTFHRFVPNEPSSSKPFVRKNLNGKTIFTEKGDSDFGEYYEINGRGNLNVYDDQGLIATYLAAPTEN